MGFPMKMRVIQWATGPVGAAQLREIIDAPDLELAGVFVYSPEKVGVDAGTPLARHLGRARFSLLDVLSSLLASVVAA